MAAQYANTDFKLAGPLAGLYTGINQAQEEERAGLANAYQAAQTPTKLLEGQEAINKMNDPRYLQMKLQTDLSELGNKYDSSQLQASQDKWTRAAIEIKTSSDPVGTAKKLMSENNIPLDSPLGKMLIENPTGTAENMVNTVAMLQSRTAKQVGAESLENLKGDWKMKEQELQNKGSAASASISANAMAANRDTNALITEEKNARAAVSQYDTAIEKYKRGDQDAEILASIRKNDPKKSASQAKTEVQEQRALIVKQLQTERNNLVKRANDYGNAINSRFKLGQKPSSGSGSSTTIQYDDKGNRI